LLHTGGTAVSEAAAAVVDYSLYGSRHAAWQYVAELHYYLNVTATPPTVRKRIAARRISTADAAAAASSAPYFRPQMQSQLRQQQLRQQQLRQQQLRQQQLRQQQLRQQQQQRQRQWVRTDPDGEISVVHDDDDV